MLERHVYTARLVPLLLAAVIVTAGQATIAAADAQGLGRSIEKLQQKFPRSTEYPRLFFAKALRAVREDPAAYGAGPVHAA